VWFNNIYDDYEMYCRTPYSRWENRSAEFGVEAGWNPVYQGREVTQYSQSHDIVEVDKQEELKQSDNAFPEGPCGTEPRLI
jgi:hypothetical protein